MIESKQIQPMGRLGVELSDAGIQVAGGRPAGLLAVDQQSTSSPGYALLQKKKLLVGGAAECLAHIYPQKSLNNFWDQLGTEALEHPAKGARNRAELAFAHLKHVWAAARAFGDSMVVAVPDHYARTQLGLLLGMARELGVSVKGFSPIPIAAASDPEPGDILLYLDIHLHRMELTCMRQADRLYRVDSASLPGKGLIHWHREFVEAIASEFVHTTRFDPLHRAETEQQLYNRLPAIAEDLKNNAAAGIELPTGRTTYRAMISIDQLLRRSSESLGELNRAVEQMRARWAPASDLPVALLVSQRLARLPGIVRKLSDNAEVRVRQLRPGAAALGVLAQWERSDTEAGETAAPFRTSKPWPSIPGQKRRTSEASEKRLSPSHLLHESVAHPIGKDPLTVECHFHSKGGQVSIHKGPAMAGEGYAVLQRRGDDFFLQTFEVPNARVNDRRISGSTKVMLGDVIRLGENGDVTLKLIACLQNDKA